MARHVCSAAPGRFFSFLLLLLPCFCLFSSQVHASQHNTTQVQIVKSIFHTIRLYMSPYKFLNTTAADPCAWREVTCDYLTVTSEAVIDELSFSDLGIAFNNSTALSSFFSLICSLDTLLSLDLSNNRFTSLPGAFFSSCVRLYSLDLSQNFLSGKIPYQFSNFTYLLYLNLNGNNLNGSIPSSLTNMIYLLELRLGDNKLIGTIPLMPPSIGALNLSHNYFGGPIPSSSFNYSSGLEIVDLSHNNFSGSVPNSLTRLRDLFLLDLSYNNLSGELPIFDNLVNLVITGNNFSLSANITDSYSKSRHSSPYLQKKKISKSRSEISTVSLVVIVGSFVNGMVASFSLAFVITTCLKKPESTDNNGNRPQGTTRPSVETPSLDRYLELYNRWQHAALVGSSTSP